MQKPKICLNAMVGNESHIIERMLNSCYQYIDYYIIQCNGNDDTQQKIENYFKEKNVKGFCYQTEWKYPGFNSDHLIQKCNESNHNCDWLLRIDADEQIIIKDTFNWNILDSENIEAYNIVATNECTSWFRSKLWNAKKTWKFEHDKRHERILVLQGENFIEPYNITNLSTDFYHFITSTGKSHEDPCKFLKDALILEQDLICENKLKLNRDHLYYLAQSYSDASKNEKYELKEKQQKEYARRAIFYLNQYIDIFENKQQNEAVYHSLFLIGKQYEILQENEKAILYYEKCTEILPQRNEHYAALAEIYLKMKDFKNMLLYAKILILPFRKNPFPNLIFFINNSIYIDTGNYGKYLYELALKNE